jgi:hypothetical protein
MYKKTPYRTGIGIWHSKGVSKTEHPIVKKINMCVTRCSLTPKNWGFSPGAAVSDSNFNEFTWLILSTVAATNLENIHKLLRAIWSNGKILPRDSQNGTNLYQNCKNEQIEMVTTTLLQFVFPPINNNCGNLLIHENENCSQHCRKYGDVSWPPRIPFVEWTLKIEIKNG